jgi:hypothetical protein
LGAEAELFIITGFPDNEYALPAICFGPGEARSDKPAADSYSLPVGQHGDGPQAECPERCCHSRKHDMAGYFIGCNRHE